LHNTWLDQIKKSGRQALDMVDNGPEEVYEEPPQMAREAVFRFFERMRGEEAKERVADALAQLPPHLREIIILRDIKGCAYEEIAEISGEKIGTVKSRLARARDRLREELSRSATAVPAAAEKNT